ncbi:MAG: ABC transporter permease subunit [Lachnospiraceae bacterium]|nr:ABC transporter permease subunit [Lachnospiraceae bacterium]
MKQLIAFTKKECMEIWRNGKCLLLIIIFVLFGIMNPAIAKLTPWLMKQFSESLEESGLIFGEVSVDAMTSWTQFYKNIPMGLIMFLLIFSGILTTELQKGTLINMLTKGLSRNVILLSKTTVMLVLWTVGYWMCFGITYVYNAYFWDNGIAKHLYFGAFCVYLLGVWLIVVLIMMSVIFSSASSVLVGTGSVFFVSYLCGLLPNIKKYLPTKLMNASELLYGVGEKNDYMFSIGIAIGLSIIQFIIAIVLFHKRKV